MHGTIRLSERERKMVLKVYRGKRDARTARRAHLLLLLAGGYSWRDIMAQTFYSSSLIRSDRHSMRTGGVHAVLGRGERRPVVVAWWLLTVLRWLQTQAPRDFGFFHWRWKCGLLALLLWQRHRFRVSGETVRRALHEQGFVWRRPRPIVGPTDPEYDGTMRAIRRLLDNLGPSEAAVFQDEVDIHLNPKIGSQWMKRGQQAEVRTPGNNEKHHLSGSLDWRIGRLYVSAPHQRRNAQLFVDHLEDLRRRLRRDRVIHVICDHARFHDCRLVRHYLAQHSGRFQWHFLPTYAPEINPIERVWWHLHDTITRNHRCTDLPHLLNHVNDDLETINQHYFEMRSVFDQAA